MTPAEREITRLTREMVGFRSTKENSQEVEKCLDYIKEYFSEDEFIIREYESNGRKSMVISFEETKEPEYLLHGHVDVVGASEPEMFEPEVRDGKIYGRGTADMKAGVACLMNLMKVLAKRDERPSVALMIVSDEEIGGFDGAGYLFGEVGYEPDFAISAEPNNMEEYLDIVAKQKGVLRVHIGTSGKSSHASRPWKGENAAEKLFEKYSEIRELFPENLEKTWCTTANLGVVEAGEAVNSVPDSALLKLDVRWSKSYKPEEIKKDLKNIDGIEAEYPVEEPMLDNDFDNAEIQNLKKEIENVTGQECHVTKKEPGSDMRFLTEKGIPAVVFGPEGYNSHGPDEHAVIESFEDYFNILKRIL